MTSNLRLPLLFAVAFTLSAADISGIWGGQTTDRNGDVQDVSFRFSQAGDSFTGKMYGDNGSTNIQDGKITGNEITFLVTLELNGQVIKTTYTGTLVLNGPGGDEMKLTRQRLGVNPAAGDKGKGRNFRQTLTLKRVA